MLLSHLFASALINFETNSQWVIFYWQQNVDVGHMHDSWANWDTIILSPTAQFRLPVKQVMMLVPSGNECLLLFWCLLTQWWVQRGQQFQGGGDGGDDSISDLKPNTWCLSCCRSSSWWSATVHYNSLIVSCGVCAVIETWSPRTCSLMRRTTSASLTSAWPLYRWETACWRPAAGEYLHAVQRLPKKFIQRFWPCISGNCRHKSVCAK